MSKKNSFQALVYRQSLCALSVILLTACASSPATLSVDDERPEVKAADRIENIVVTKIEDKRERSSEITDMQNRAMSDADVLEWVAQGFIDGGIEVSEKASEVSSEDMCLVEVDLRRAFVSAANTAKSGNIVLSVRVNGASDEALIRGSDTTMNWWGSSGESNAALKRALDDAVSQVPALCP